MWRPGSSAIAQGIHHFSRPTLYLRERQKNGNSKWLSDKCWIPGWNFFLTSAPFILKGNDHIDHAEIIKHIWKLLFTHHLPPKSLRLALKTTQVCRPSKACIPVIGGQFLRNPFTHLGWRSQRCHCSCTQQRWKSWNPYIHIIYCIIYIYNYIIIYTSKLSKQINHHILSWLCAGATFDCAMCWK